MPCAGSACESEAAACAAACAGRRCPAAAVGPPARLVPNRAQRGEYLKLSETGSKRPRSTVLLPAAAVKWVYSLIDYYIRETAAG